MVGLDAPALAERFGLRRVILAGVVAAAAGVVVIGLGVDVAASRGVLMLLAFATFLSFMTIGRIVGTGLLDRYGRVPVLRISFALAVAGALLVIFGGAALAFVGAAIWGIGAALGFPVGMSASADDPARAAARMSVVATIGYAAFIAGPSLLGFLGDHVGVLRSLLVVGAGAILALLVVTSVREPEAGTDPREGAQDEGAMASDGVPVA